MFKNDLVAENPSKDFAANNKGNGISPPAFAIEFILLVIPIFKSCKSSSITLLHSLKSLVILIKIGKIETIESIIIYFFFCFSVTISSKIIETNILISFFNSLKIALVKIAEILVKTSLKKFLNNF